MSKVIDFQEGQRVRLTQDHPSVKELKKGNEYIVAKTSTGDEKYVLLKCPPPIIRSERYMVEKKFVTIAEDRSYEDEDEEEDDDTYFYTLAYKFTGLSKEEFDKRWKIWKSDFASILFDNMCKAKEDDGIFIRESTATKENEWYAEDGKEVLLIFNRNADVKVGDFLVAESWEEGMYYDTVYFELTKPTKIDGGFLAKLCGIGSGEGVEGKYLMKGTKYRKINSSEEDEKDEEERGDHGMKNDFADGKQRWDLLPLPQIAEIVKLYTEGAKKYAPNSWQKLDNGYQRYKGAMLRHLLAYEMGERSDSETKANHLAAVAWNAIAMLYFDMNGRGLYE